MVAHRYTFLHKSITEHNPTPLTPNEPEYTHTHTHHTHLFTKDTCPARFTAQCQAIVSCDEELQVKGGEEDWNGNKKCFTGERVRDVVMLP